jgi:hypothetical protein
MIEKKFYYPFPNVRILFLYLLLLCLPFLIISKFAFIVVLILVMSLTTLIINAFPTIRLKSEGIEIDFYFPFLSKWFFMPWSAIEQIKIIDPPLQPLHRSKHKPNIMVYSHLLPKYYHLPALLYGRTWKKGFMILNKINGYEEIMMELRTTAK